jgi:transposase-like protein
MPRMYAATVRRQIVAPLRSGEAVAALAAETGICQATLFRWKHQALIDVGVIEGIPSVDADELASAHERIAQLEAELALTRDACELFNAEAVVPPKRRRAIVEGLIARGHSARSACRITRLTRSLLQYHRRRPVPDCQIRRLDLEHPSAGGAGELVALPQRAAVLGPGLHRILKAAVRAAPAQTISRRISDARSYWSSTTSEA